MKTTIIEVLNKIANDEEVIVIYYRDRYFKYDNSVQDFYCEQYDEYLFDEYVLVSILNDEVEILETTITYKQDDKIERINYDIDTTYEWSFGEVYDKINEIIDRLNGD